MKSNRVCFSVLIFLIAITLQGIANATETPEICIDPDGSRDTLLVVSVPEQSVYEEAGLREGDRITGIDFTPVEEMTFPQAVSAVSRAGIPGHSIILSILEPSGTRLVHISSSMPDPRQEAFLLTERNILEAWETSRSGWENFIRAACEFALGRKSPQELFRTFRSSRSSFTDSRNRLISVEIPSLLPSGIRSSLSSAKSRLADANTLRNIATRILYRSLVSGENPIPAEETLSSAYLAAYIVQDIKSRLVSETGTPGFERAWKYLRINFLQAKTPDGDSEPLPEKLVTEAGMAVREARDRLERISDLGVLAEEVLSYTAASEYGAATLLGGMMLRYPAVEKKANIAAGEGFGYLIKARAGMALR